MNATQRMESVRTVQRVDQDSAGHWPPGGAVASFVEADQSAPSCFVVGKRCAKHVEDSKQVAQRWPEDIGAMAELEAALTRAKAHRNQALSVHESRCCHRGSEVEGHQAREGSSPPVPTELGGRVGATDHRIGAGARCIPSRSHPNEEEKSSDPQTSTKFARGIRC